jgi:UDP-glucose 4-epimerase
MRYLITGGAGFIGSHVLGHIKKFNHSCIVLDNFSTGVHRNIPSEIKVYERDICHNGMEELLIAEGIDVVIHLAGQTMVPVSQEHPAFDCSVNVLGSVGVLDACRKAGVKRVVFASTAAVYGYVDQLPITEEQAGDPISFYGLSKYTFERYLEFYWQQFGLNYVILRFANVYGERQGDGGEGGVISIFTRKIKQAEAVTIFGDGAQTRDFIYAGDVAGAIYQASLSPNTNRAYNISTQIETSVNELVTCFERITGEPIARSYSEARTGDIARSVLSNHRAQRCLNWKPEVDLLEGLRRTYQFL